jgi:hypothetical protein
MIREIEVTIIGTYSLLMHNAAGMTTEEGGKKIENRTREEQLASSLYWLDDKHTSLAVPARALRGAFIKAGAKFKAGKISLATLITGSLHIEPEMISLHTKTYEEQTEGVVNPNTKGRIIISRPRIPKGWQLTFTIGFDDEWLPLSVMQKTFPEVIAAAGQLVGILAYRVEKKGPHGTFRLAEYKLLALRKQEPIPAPRMVGWEGVSTTKPAKAQTSGRLKKGLAAIGQSNSL